MARKAKQKPKPPFLIKDDGTVYLYNEIRAARKDMKPYWPSKEDEQEEEKTEDGKEDEPDPGPSGIVALEDMTKEELDAYAQKEFGVNLPDRMKKSEMLARIKELQLEKWAKE